MISGHLVNSLLSVSHQLFDNSNETLLLLASNNIQTCLFNFNCKLTVQPIMLNVPFNVESPQSINKYYPFSSEDTFNRGMQILKNGQNFFTISLLLNNGDIYMQDFLCNQNESINEEKSENFNDFKYENNICNTVYFNNEFDSITKNYMKKIMKYVKYLNADKILFCDNCAKIPPDDNHCANFLDSLKNQLHLESEDQLHNIISTNGSQVLKNDLKFHDKDGINFEYIKENWYQMKSDPTVGGIRQYCTKLTKKLFDQWCNNTFEID